MTTKPSHLARMALDAWTYDVFTGNYSGAAIESRVMSMALDLIGDYC